MATQKEIEQVRSELWSWSKDQRRTTLDYVQKLPREQAFELIAELFTASEHHRQERLDRSMLGRLIGFFILMIGGCTLLFGEFEASITMYSYGALWLFCVTAMFYLASRKIYPKAALKLLPHFQSARLIGPLLMTIAYTDGDDLKQLRHALAQSSPLCMPSEYELLSPPERKTLYKQLLAPNDDLASKLIDLIPNVEDTAALPYLNALRKDSKDESVRMKSSNAVARLNAIQHGLKLHSTLLRPASEPGNSEELLRPISSVENEPQDQLLRPMGEHHS